MRVASTKGLKFLLNGIGAEDELRFKYEGFLEKAYASSVKQVRLTQYSLPANSTAHIVCYQ